MSGAFKRTLFWTSDWIQGSPVGKHYRDIAMAWGNRDICMAIQDSHLTDLLSHTVCHSSFYAKYDGAELSQFPISDKNFLTAHHENIAVDVSNLPFQKGPIHIQRTSGSTGTPFAIPQDTRKRLRRLASLKFFGQLSGFKSHEKLIHCRVWTNWQSKTSWQSFRENIIPFNVNKMNEERVIALCDLIDQKRAVAILGYAGWFDHLAAYLEKSGRKLKTLRVILSSAEMLKEGTREKLNQTLHCRIVERYADEEAGIMGQQNSHGTEYYLDHSSYLFEMLKMDSDEPAPFGELGRLVITDLFNYAFPLIRYDTGDTGIMASGNERSGGLPYLQSLFGRQLDLVYDTSGNPVAPMTLARILKNIPWIIQWQFIQKEERRYLLRLNVVQRDNVSECVGLLKEIFGENADIEIEYLDEIPILRSGKMKPVVCEYHKNN